MTNFDVNKVDSLLLASRAIEAMEDCIADQCVGDEREAVEHAIMDSVPWVDLIQEAIHQALLKTSQTYRQTCYREA